MLVLVQSRLSVSWKKPSLRDFQLLWKLTPGWSFVQKVLYWLELDSLWTQIWAQSQLETSGIGAIAKIMPRPGAVSLEVTLRQSPLVCIWIEQTAIASDMSLEPQDFTFQTHSLMQFKFKCRECMCIRLAFSTPELCGSQPKPTDTPILPALHTVTDKPGQLHCCPASAMVLFAHPYRKAREGTSSVVKYCSFLRQMQGNSAFLQSKAGPETKTTKWGIGILPER